MHKDVMIEIVVVADKAGGNSKVVYLYEDAPSDDAMDIYVSEVSKSIALYRESSYDRTRLALRNNQQMTFPGNPGEKLILVGQVRRTLDYDPATQLEVSRAPLRLKAIPIDEW